jgi:zinc transport system substrate-binding protein
MIRTTPLLHRRPALLALALVVATVLGAGAACAAEPLPVVVSILPQRGFVAEIGDDEVAVSVLVGPGHSPATYEPTPRQMAVLTTAAVFFAAGVPFERGLLPRIDGLPDGPAVAGPRISARTVGVGHGHDHGPDDLDPHTWLDPRRAAAFADTVCAALTRFRPAAAAGFAARRDALQDRLAALDAELEAVLAPVRGRAFFVFHPAYGHFARRYGLVQVAVEDAGHEPGARRLAEVTERARAAGAKAIVVQPQFSQRAAASVAAAIDAEILVLDPLAADYEANLRHIAAALAAALEAAP